MTRLSTRLAILTLLTTVGVTLLAHDARAVDADAAPPVFNPLAQGGGIVPPSVFSSDPSGGGNSETPPDPSKIDGTAGVSVLKESEQAAPSPFVEKPQDTTAAKAAKIGTIVLGGLKVEQLVAEGLTKEEAEKKISDLAKDVPSTAAMRALEASGTTSKEACGKIAAIALATGDENATRIADETRASANMGPTSELACSSMSANGVMDTFMEVAGRQAGRGETILNSVLSGAKIFSGNSSMNGLVASAITGLLEGGFKQATKSILSGLAGAAGGAAGGGGGGGGRPGAAAAPCKDSLSKITQALSCVPRNVGSANAAKVTGDVLSDPSCLDPKALSAASGMFKNPNSSSVLKGLTLSKPTATNTAVKTAAPPPVFNTKGPPGP